MKIMKVLGVVVGIHLFALILIFANPGCSSTSKPTPAPVDTLAKSEPAPAITVPGVPPGGDSGYPAVSAAPIMFNPDAPALAGGGGIRFTPTRPGTRIRRYTATPTTHRAKGRHLPRGLPADEEWRRVISPDASGRAGA